MPRLATPATWGWLFRHLIAPRARDEKLNRSGPKGRLRCGREARAQSRPTTLRHITCRYRDSTLTQLLRSSLSGQSCTSVVVAVASDREHGDESKCSLSFGQRMQGLRTRAVVGATDGGVEAAALQRELAVARRDLAAMEANGYGEHFGKDALPGEVASFKENVNALEEWQRCLAEDRAALAEIQAGGDGSQAEVNELAAAIRDGSGKVTHLKRMIERQHTVAGFYVAPRAVYSRKLAEVRALART